MKQFLLRFSLVLLSLAAAMAFLFMPRNFGDDRMAGYISQLLEERSPQFNVKYEATYSYYDRAGRASKMVVVVPGDAVAPPDPEDPVAELDMESIYRVVERQAFQEGLVLPTDYRDQVSISIILD